MSTVESEVGAEPSLASILADDPAETSAARTEVAEPTETAPAATETAERPRGEGGKFVAKDKAEATETATTTEDVKTDPPPKQERPDFVNAIIAERRKRQEAERAAAATQPNGQPKTDFFADPDRAIAERLAEHDAPTKNALFNFSLKAAQAVHGEDFASAAQAFHEAGVKDARLFDALRNAEDPGELIYSLGVQIRELSDVNGDIVKYRDKVTAKAKADLAERDLVITTKDAEIDGLKKQLAALSTVGRSLNTQTSARSAATDVEDDEPPEKIVRFGNHPKR